MITFCQNPFDPANPLHLEIKVIRFVVAWGIGFGNARFRIEPRLKRDCNGDTSRPLFMSLVHFSDN